MKNSDEQNLGIFNQNKLFLNDLKLQKAKIQLKSLNITIKQ